MSVAKRSVFRKSEVLVIMKDEDKNKDPNTERIRPIISFGVTKARAILENVPEIEQFVKDVGGAPKPEETDECKKPISGQANATTKTNS